MKTLTEVRRYLATIPYINSGGCGIAALAMYRWLEEANKFKEDTKIIYMYTFFSDAFEANSKAIKGDSPFVAPPHIVLFHKGFYVDSNNDDIDLDDYENNHYVSKEDLIETLKADNWNEMFDRGNIASIENTLQLKLN